MLALGELQKSMGPDQRVSANGAILAEGSVKHPHWTGVWDSWKAGGSSASGNDDKSEHRTIDGESNSGMHPTYEENRKDHFRSWLVSLDSEEVATVSTAKDLTLNGIVKPVNGTDAVQLVG